MKQITTKLALSFLLSSNFYNVALGDTQNDDNSDLNSADDPWILTGTNSEDWALWVPTATGSSASATGDNWEDAPWPTDASSASGANNGVIISGKTSSPTGATTLTVSKTSSALPKNTQPCNLQLEFCTRSYANITNVGAHNSMFAKEKNSASNQDLTVTQQLDDGIRMLQGQTHMKDNVVHFCHTSCDILDAGPAIDYFSIVYKWLMAHPFEVVTLLIGNGDFKDVRNFTEPLETSGLAKLAFKPKIKKGKANYMIHDWPTLGEMILMNQRVVIFMDYKADLKKVDYIIDEFDGTMWETKMSQTDPHFPCNVDRPPKQDNPANRLILANHNLDVNIDVAGNSILLPDVVQLNKTNNVTGFGSLGKQVDDCAALWQRNPNFLLVDFYNRGNGSVFEVAAKANNVTYKGGCCGKKASSFAHRETPYYKTTISLILGLGVITTIIL